MDAGSLDQEIILQSPTEQNTAGSLALTYTTVDTIMAKVISQHGGEAFEAARTNARETIRVLMRYRADVTDKWRLVWNGQNYNIVNTDRSERRKGQLWVTAEAVGAA